MTFPRHPAAYLRPCSGIDRRGMVLAARDRGWPRPTIYSDDNGSALDRLIAAISAGRHDGLLLIAGNPVPLMRLLSVCTKRGVTVSFIPPALPEGTTPAVAAVAAAPEPPARVTGEPWEVLTRARLEALASLFPGWRIWIDRHGWHARRIADGFQQGYRPGSPAFSVRADTATDLAAQLCWQQAADRHAPDGCQAGAPAGPVMAATGRQ
jgi:hypothetical protein